MRISVDQSAGQTEGRIRMNKPLREVARHVRALYDLLATGDYDYTGIYKSMSLATKRTSPSRCPGKRISNT